MQAQGSEPKKYETYKQILADISSLLLENDWQHIDKAIDRILEIIGEFLGADRSYVFRLNNEDETLTNTHEWCFLGIEPQIHTLQDIPFDKVPWWTKNIKENKIVIVRDVKDLPVEASSEKKEFTRQSIKSLLTVPVRARGEIYGFMGLDAVKNTADWDEDDISLLMTIGKIIAMALKRSEAERLVRESEMRYKALAKEYEVIFNTTQTAMFLIDVGYEGHFRYLRTNEMLQRAVGLGKGKIWGKTSTEVFEQDIAKRLEKNYNKCTAEKRPITYEETLDLPGGKRTWLTTLSPVIEDGNVTQIVGSAEDITSRKEAEEALTTEKERLAVTLESIGDGVISTDSCGKIVLMNPVAEALTGWKHEEAKNRKFEEVFHIISEETGKKCENPIERVLKYERAVGLANHTILISKDGRKISVADSAAPIRRVDGSIDGVIMVFRDISEERKKQKEIEYLSFHDKLTGLYNRAFFEKKLKRLDTERQLPISIILGDMNGLKMVNDGLGHEEGDKLLQIVANILRRVCRKEDIVARWGGDEFLILLPKADEVAAQSICNRIKRECKKNKMNNVPPSISLGWAVKKESSQNIHEVLIEAEDYMYKNKLTESSSARNSLLRSLKNTLFERSHETQEHAERLRILSLDLGKELGLSGSTLSDIELLTTLHDIGKIGVPDKVLLKETSLSEEEWDAVKKHSEIGYRILTASNELRHLAEPILSLHERWDGLGYPNGLKGEAIPLLSRIVIIVDAYDVMVNGRPYKEGISPEKALEEIKRCAGTQFDPSIADSFINMMKMKLKS